MRQQPSHDQRRGDDRDRRQREHPLPGQAFRDRPGKQHSHHAAAREQRDDQPDRRLRLSCREVFAHQDEGEGQRTHHDALQYLTEQQDRQVRRQAGHQTTGGDHGHQPDQHPFSAVAVAEFARDGGDDRAGDE
ncbi:hypothetical protein SAFG77S_04661 [Streptomyces afghaniensis]